ncbi:hypothetical protein EYC08_21165 [Tabrizicola sp. WMC-M-20]|nr:hypothetical protein EYC08_21165 [Tabrizicola sp. WMC-M-20]
MRGPDWRLRVTADGMAITRGKPPADVLRWIESEIRNNLSQIDQLPDAWRKGWAVPLVLFRNPEDLPDIG